MGETRWAQVARDLAEGISGGSFPVGSLLPTELELCDRYGASRHTVRSAIRELQDLGLVSRRKKVGTRVEAAHPSAGYQQSLASIEDLVQFGASHRREVQEVQSVIADRTLAKTLGCEAGSSWLPGVQPAFEGGNGGAPGRLDGCLRRPGFRGPPGEGASVTRRAHQRAYRAAFWKAYRRDPAGHHRDDHFSASCRAARRQGR
jgi:DNA-binding transcriptional regulator YhcF (GntR family)